MGVTDITIFLNSISLEEFIKLIKEYNNLIDERLQIRKLYKGRIYKTVNKITKDEFYGEEVDDIYDIFVKTLSDEYKNNLLNESIDEYEYKNKVYKLYEDIYEDVYYQDKTETDLYEGMVKIAYLCHSKNKNEIDVINFCSTEGNFNCEIASFLMNSGVPEKDIEFFDETKDCIYIGNIDFF